MPTHVVADVRYSFAYSDGFNSTPLPFPCSITPRSPTHAKVIEQEFNNTMPELKAYMSPPN